MDGVWNGARARLDGSREQLGATQTKLANKAKLAGQLNRPAPAKVVSAVESVRRNIAARPIPELAALKVAGESAKLRQRGVTTDGRTLRAASDAGKVIIKGVKGFDAANRTELYKFARWSGGLLNQAARDKHAGWVGRMEELARFTAPDHRKSSFIMTPTKQLLKPFQTLGASQPLAKIPGDSAVLNRIKKVTGGQLFGFGVNFLETYSREPDRGVNGIIRAGAKSVAKVAVANALKKVIPGVNAVLAVSDVVQFAGMATVWALDAAGEKDAAATARKVLGVINLSRHVDNVVGIAVDKVLDPALQTPRGRGAS